MTTLEQWREWAPLYDRLPFVQRYELEETRLIAWDEVWKRGNDHAFVLESGKGGRYTFLALEPTETIRGKNGRAVVTRNGAPSAMMEGDPLSVVQQWLGPFGAPKVEGAPKWLGGCCGYWSYDVARSIERLPNLADDDLDLPEYVFCRVDRLWIVDHETNALYVAIQTNASRSASQANAAGGGNDRLGAAYDRAAETARGMKRTWDHVAAINRNEQARQRRSERERVVAGDSGFLDVAAIPGVTPDFSRTDYIKAVERIQAYIGQGDIFQVNLSVRQNKKLHAAPETVYEWLRLVNPSPYMGMMKYGDFSLVSGSPELLVQLEDGIVRTRPIAGTRPRGRDEVEDLRLAAELIGHEKERAEHIMLVDLLRNDLGRISAYGTVKVTDLMVIEYYSHVMHIVSQVEGRLADSNEAFDVIAASFPGGTITGAPKVRTMEIIEELEPVRRGPYTGSIGWIDYGGNMEFNIVIRTMVVKEGVGYVQAGAGIVIDSVPEKEYTESINKAKALWKAIQYSESAK